jgi:hypothetical protein
MIKRVEFGVSSAAGSDQHGTRRRCLPGSDRPGSCGRNSKYQESGHRRHSHGDYGLGRHFKADGVPPDFTRSRFPHRVSLQRIHRKWSRAGQERRPVDHPRLRLHEPTASMRAIWRRDAGVSRWSSPIASSKNSATHQLRPPSSEYRATSANSASLRFRNLRAG